ncbi:hypothetical protein TRFO_23379 [Tritrichomonas foetus]|uniref:Uncharacterized protein n=1 Tax=Tritrichomonas foetus TaxID=1144522 RepID=A0A1J4KFP8_9EUKA|nr:hypothetical protein TRFO_23379 [Tritrichomonas foetus]|eukprot:OHT08173.1 hypothetical protein TRFO_23379 [Tritrichomonas foetus]
MYRQYRYLPEVNRPCCRATRSREYQAHIDALHRIKSKRGTLDNSHPNTPQTIGRNYKRYENEKQRNLQIRKDNMRLVGNLDRIAREEHYPRAVPQRPFTLQGKVQKEEMLRITRENHKLLNAVQERRPILNRNDWLMHKIDHSYQVAKNAEYQQTVPMSEIMRREIYTSQDPYGRSPYEPSYASSARKSINSARRSTATASSARDLEDETNDRVDGLLGKGEEEETYQSSQKGNSHAGSRVDLEDETNDRVNGLLGKSEEEEKYQSSQKGNSKASSRADLEDETNNRVDGLLGNENDGEEKERSDSQNNSQIADDEEEDGQREHKHNHADLEDETNDRVDGLLGNEEGAAGEDEKGSHAGSRADLEDETNDRVNGLLG